MRLYYPFSEFLKEKFGCRVHKISLDAGFSCPNRDGTLSRKGCIFCNNKAFSFFSREKFPLEEQISRSIEFAKERFKAKKFIAYFQAFTNTYGEAKELKKKYDVIKRFPDIVGLSISTRPDCIDISKIELIQSYTKDYLVFVEYGLQSANNPSLNWLNRNHTFEDFLKAVDITANRAILICAHIILGIPQESKEDVANTAKAISSLPLWGIKFHCLHAVRETYLERLYNQGKVKLPAEKEYIELVCNFLELIPPDWVILRLISGASKEYLIAPKWVNQKQFIISKIEEELKKRGSYQGKRFKVQGK